MQTLDEHNRSITEYLAAKNRRPAGVLCPKCKTEMEFINDMVLTSYPSQRAVKCSCGYSGYKVGA